MLNRRLFLGGLLVAGASAPAFVRSGVLMPVKQAIIVPDFSIEFVSFPRRKVYVDSTGQWSPAYPTMAAAMSAAIKHGDRVFVAPWHTEVCSTVLMMHP